MKKKFILHFNKLFLFSDPEIIAKIHYQRSKNNVGSLPLQTATSENAEIVSSSLQSANLSDSLRTGKTEFY